MHEAGRYQRRQQQSRFRGYTILYVPKHFNTQYPPATSQPASTPLLHQGHCDDALELRNPNVARGDLPHSNVDLAGAHRKSCSRHEG